MGISSLNLKIFCQLAITSQNTEGFLKQKSNVGKDQVPSQQFMLNERRNMFNDSKHHFESIEDSIAEEKFDDLDMDSSAKLDMKSPFLLDHYTNAYNSDVAGRTQITNFKANKKMNIEKKAKEFSVLSNSFGQNKFKNAYLESSFDNQNKILINDQDQLHVIMERKPRKSKNLQNQQLKKKEKTNNFNSNYRKRVLEVEKQKKMIQEIEERYKEYSVKINPNRNNENK